MGTSAITGVYARGLFHKKRLDNTRAGRETRSFRIPGEPRSPAPASDEAMNFCETSNAPRRKTPVPDSREGNTNTSHYTIPARCSK